MKYVMDANNDGGSIIPLNSIEKMIYMVRNVQVILDRDLAMLYEVETKQLKRQVKRNIERFPDDFMFQLTKEELSILRCQNGTSRWGGERYMPFAFTKNGVAMLSGVLNSDKAIGVNIKIMRAFTLMSSMIPTNPSISQRLSNIEYHQIETDKRIDDIFRRFNPDQPTEGIFSNGQIFDAYTFISDLIRKAGKEIVLIDNYIDDTVLKMLDKREQHVSATIYTAHISEKLQIDMAKHNTQYSPINIEVLKSFHDRFLIIDDEVWHIGASLKDLGKKVVAFSKMELPKEAILLMTVKSLKFEV